MDTMTTTRDTKRSEKVIGDKKYIIKLKGDRGDNIKKNNEDPSNNKKPKSVEIKIYFPDRGDLQQKSPKEATSRLIKNTDDESTSEESRSTNKNSKVVEGKPIASTISDKIGIPNKKIDSEKKIIQIQNMARTVDIYSKSVSGNLTRNNIVHKPDRTGKSDVINVPSKKPPQIVKDAQQLKKSSTLRKFNRSTSTENDSINPITRKPVIRTMTTKGNSKIYKAVSFVEKKEPTHLEVKIPSEISDKKIKTKSTEIIDANIKPKNSKLSVSSKKNNSSEHKPVRNKKHKKSKDDYDDEYGYPSTEVTKWAPASINPHTKPYYEAWVNTTLAAISKVSKNDDLYRIKQNIIQNFQRSLEENFEERCNLDEKFTGKIKVTQKRKQQKACT